MISDRLIKILRDEGIRRIDGRYLNGFWSTVELENLYSAKQIKVKTIKGVQFFYYPKVKP